MRDWRDVGKKCESCRWWDLDAPIERRDGDPICRVCHRRASPWMKQADDWCYAFEERQDRPPKTTPHGRRIRSKEETKRMPFPYPPEALECVGDTATTAEMPGKPEPDPLEKYPRRWIARDHCGDEWEYLTREPQWKRGEGRYDPGSNSFRRAMRSDFGPHVCPGDCREFCLVPVEDLRELLARPKTEWARYEVIVADGRFEERTGCTAEAVFGSRQLQATFRAEGADGVRVRIEPRVEGGRVALRTTTQGLPVQTGDED